MIRVLFQQPCSLLLTQHKTGLLSCLILTVETALFTPVGSSALNSGVRTGLNSTVDNNACLQGAAQHCSRLFRTVLFRPVDNLQQVVRFYQWRRHGVDWGGHVHPSSLQNRFFSFSKFVEKTLGGTNQVLIQMLFTSRQSKILRQK